MLLLLIFALVPLTPALADGRLTGNAIMQHMNDKTAFWQVPGAPAQRQYFAHNRTTILEDTQGNTIRGQWVATSDHLFCSKFEESEDWHCYQVYSTGPYLRIVGPVDRTSRQSEKNVMTARMVDGNLTSDKIGPIGGVKDNDAFGTLFSTFLLDSGASF